MHQVESDNLAARLSATRVLCAMAAANAEVCYAVASRIVPAVCTACQKLSQVGNCHGLLKNCTSKKQEWARNITCKKRAQVGNADEQQVPVGSCQM